MFFSLLGLVGFGLIARAIYVFLTLSRKATNKRQRRSILAIAGSGGHTSELIRLLESLPNGFSPRHYVVATSDQMSLQKIKQFEENHFNDKIDYSIYKIPRSREVAQSWLSTIYTTFMACLASLIVVYKSKPDILLCNGPGTCIPICIVALLYKVFGLCSVDVVYVESICRVTSMSMSGRLIYPFANRFYVQWPQLLNDFPKAIYLGGRVV